MQLGAAPAGRNDSGMEIQRGVVAAGRGCSGARPQRGAAAAGWGCGGAGMLLGADAAGCGCGCCGCSGAVPQFPTAPSLSLQLCVERGKERTRGASLIPLFVLWPSPSHTSSSTSPNSPLSLLTNPPLPISMALLNLPVYPPLPSLLPLPLHSSPFPLPSFPSLSPCEELGTHVFPLSLALPVPSRPPLLPFSLFPSLSLTILVTSPNPFVFPSRGR